MNYTRIIDDTPAQTYPAEWLEENAGNMINGELVFEWELAPEYTGNFVKPKWDGTEYYEGATLEEVNAKLTALAIEIDLEYTERISKLFAKHMNKKTLAAELGQVYVIPQVTLDEVEALAQECNQKILEVTGITDYTYRQQHPVLAKGEIIDL